MCEEHWENGRNGGIRLFRYLIRRIYYDASAGFAYYPLNARIAASIYKRHSANTTSARECGLEEEESGAFFTHLALFNALGHDYSQRVPGLNNPGDSLSLSFFFFHFWTGCARASPELIYYGGRNVPAMLTPVIGNNVCRERIEKETRRGYGKRERVQRVFYSG